MAIPNLTSSSQAAARSGDIFTGSSTGVTAGGVNFGTQLKPATLGIIAATVIIGLLILKRR